MKPRAKQMLGLAVGERSILVAEVTLNAEALEVTRAGEFSYAEGISLAKPAALGAALGLFLKAEGYTARLAVVGVPAKWVLTKAKELPPVAPSMAADMLRIQVENEFSSELKDLVYDYAGESSATAPAQVLLAASPRRHIAQIEAIAEAARIEVHAISPTTVVLGIATTRETDDAMVLSITQSGTEFMARRGASPTLLRYVGSGSTISSVMAGEVRRASLQNSSHANGGRSINGHSNGSIVVWDDLATDGSARSGVTTALGPSARAGRWADLLGGNAPAGGSAAAVALAVAGVRSTGLPIDFLHSRLAPPEPRSIKRQLILAGAAAAIVVLGIILALVNLQSQESELAAMNLQLAAKTEDKPAAEKYVAMVTQAKAWHADKPRYLQCLADITRAFADSEHMFATRLDLHKDLGGAIAGKMPGTGDRRDQDPAKSVQALGERLTATNHFTDVNASWERHDERVGGEVTFKITFKFIPHD